jgi:hypothetical protein
MTGVFVLLFFAVIGPLALLFGHDSRSDDACWWPGSPREKHLA